MEQTVAPQASKDPGARAGGVLFGVARIAAPHGWLAFVSGPYDTEGQSLGHILLLEAVNDELKVTGRSGKDPFVEGLAWADEGGKPISLGAPVLESTTLRLPKFSEEATWFSKQLGLRDGCGA